MSSLNDRDILRSDEVQRSQIELGEGRNDDHEEKTNPVGDEIKKTRSATLNGNHSSAFLDLDSTPIQLSTISETNQYLHDIRPATTHHGPQKLQNLRNVKSTSTMLPLELLSLIFRYCQEWRGTAIILPGNHWFPWVLGQVCSHWRQVLWAITELWSDIQIRSNLSQVRQAILPSILHQVMTHTQGLVSMEVPVLEIEIFTKVMTPYPGRFQSLRLTLSFDLLGIFLNLPFDYFTSLKSLDVTIAQATLVRPVMAHQTGALREAPHLDSFSISYPYQIKRLGPIYAPSGLWLPWSQLTLFKCHGAHSIADLHDVLSQCTNLVECSVVVRASYTGETSDDHHSPIILPHLRNLSIKPFSREADWVTFLEPFVLPSLEVLGCENWVLEAFEALVSRSRCSLRELECFMEASYTDDLLDADGLCDFLRMLPSLVSLSTIPLPPIVFELMSRGELLPQITTLNCSVDIDGLDAFLDLMEQFSTGHGIQSAHISLFHELNEADDVNRRFIDVCERFATEGRDITMEIIAD